MTIRILPDHYQTMLHSVQGLVPQEACGLLAGQNDTSSHVYSIENMLHSPVRFLMQPQQQLNALLEIEQKGWEVLAIYHSHPQGPDVPSETDIREYYYPDIPCLIWFRGEAGWECRAFTIQDGHVSNAEIELLE